MRRNKIILFFLIILTNFLIFLYTKLQYIKIQLLFTNKKLVLILKRDKLVAGGDVDEAECKEISVFG